MITGEYILVINKNVIILKFITLNNFFGKQKLFVIVRVFVNMCETSV